jgi:methyltransferase (TIGR00027 family)
MRHPLIVTYGKIKSMQRETHEIGHVSDTALMTAACRAMETERPDGLVRDPFAAQLAGARGMAIANALDRLEVLCFGIAIRSRFLDHLVLDTVTQHGISTVLSLGAGLDSRPWRLELPATLRWVEVDFPEMLDYKDGVLASAAPKCRRERLAADINEASGRQSIFAAAAGPTLMITEGLLMYLPASTIETLADSAPVSHWMLDVASVKMRQRLQMSSYQSIENVRAADHIEGGEILDVLHRHNWSPLRSLKYGTDTMQYAADRIMSMFRNVPADQIPKPLPDDPSGVHLYARH